MTTYILDNHLNCLNEFQLLPQYVYTEKKGKLFIRKSPLSKSTIQDSLLPVLADIFDATTLPAITARPVHKA